MKTIEEAPNEKKLHELQTSQVRENSWLFSLQGICFVSSSIILAILAKERFVSPLSNLYKENPMNQCGLVMANSTLPNSGWGMFPLHPLEAGQPVSYGDPVIQVPDITGKQGPSISYLLHNYMWSGDVTGGIHEGHVVYSVLPGVGSLANGHPHQWNMVMGNTEYDNAGVKRGRSQGAGAFTHYHNFRFHAHGRIEGGQELMVNYGRGWLDKISHDDLGRKTKRPVEWLRSNGICLDHIRPSISEIPHAGRGAFATRSLPQGTVVAPIPLLPIKSRDALRRPDGTWQLLLNYCYSHPQSSLLLVPYAPVVNLVNHGSKGDANVRIQWSTSTLFSGAHLLKQRNIFESNPSGLLMELVAIKDLKEGDEILLDYGEAWQAAWDHHTKEFSPFENDYEYASESNRQFHFLKTSDEFLVEKYPSNLRTTCYYKFESTYKAGPINWIPPQLQFQNLFPCTILQRFEANNTYTVLIQNPETKLNTVKIPDAHVVQNVPRYAIRLDDKMRSSDQNLKEAFRHEIHIPDDIFPISWRDLDGM
jgi:hypothetical protein